MRKDLRMYPWDYDSGSSEYRYVYDHVFSIFSAIQFKNEDGEPKTIPVTEIEQIFIKYTIRKYFPKYSPPKTFTITTSVGTTHDVIVRANWGDREYISREYNPLYTLSADKTRVSQWLTYHQVFDIQSCRLLFGLDVSRLNPAARHVLTASPRYIYAT